MCDKNYLMETSQSVFNFGVMVGAIIFTSMADRLGRKPIYLACQYCMLVIGIIVAFSPNYITFVVLRFFLGAVREVNSYHRRSQEVQGVQVHPKGDEKKVLGIFVGMRHKWG